MNLLYSLSKVGYNMQEITKEVLKFRDDRGWAGNHNVKNLAISISLEANELLECFQWTTAEESIAKDKQAIVDEMADVLIYLIQMADCMNIDLEKAVKDKLVKNAIKYPLPEKIIK